MDAARSLRHFHSPTVAADPTPADEGPTTAAGPACNGLKSTVELPSLSTSTISGGKLVTSKKKNSRKMKKRPWVDSSDAASSSVASPCTASHWMQSGIRVLSNKRNPRFLIGSARQKARDVEALALPLGMSIAAVIAQVLDRKDTDRRMSADHLSMICTLAVRESLVNVFGGKFDSFVKNFEKSFRSTLMTLRLVNESSQVTSEHHRHLNKESASSDAIHPVFLEKENHSICSSGVQGCLPQVDPPDTCLHELFGTLEEIRQNMLTGPINRELALHDRGLNQQLALVSPFTRRSAIDQSVLGTLEKSVIEQTRSNELKNFEISLSMRKLQLKEKQLALNSDTNFLERCKLSMGISKASFKAEKFKNELEETKYAEMLKKCRDCLVAGLLIMLASIAYGAYVYSHNRISEATASCTPSKDSKSWWMLKPMLSFNSGLQMLWCQVQVLCRMLFGLLMILAIVYLLLQRSTVSTQTMPVTFVLLLGVACGLAGKLCIDTLGGSGYCWLLYWEVLCLLHFFSNVCTSVLFLILHGPITVHQTPNNNIFPYWIRRVLFYAITLLFLPLSCGLMPFASPAEWKDHFILQGTELFATSW